MRIMRKLKSSGGFSLAELLVATLILVMVSVVTVGGIPTARNAYEKVTMGANAQVLLSTAIAALRNELGTASGVSVSDDTTITYTSAATGGTCVLYTEDTDGIMLQQYIGFTTAAGSTVSAGTDSVAEGMTDQLISDAAATDDLYVTYGGAAVTDGVVTITDLEVRRTTDDDSTPSRAYLETLNIRVIRDA